MHRMRASVHFNAEKASLSALLSLSPLACISALLSDSGIMIGTEAMLAGAEGERDSYIVLLNQVLLLEDRTKHTGRVTSSSIIQGGIHCGVMPLSGCCG